MNIKVKAGYCASTDIFTINGIPADIDDFGECYDDNKEAAICAFMPMMDPHLNPMYLNVIIFHTLSGMKFVIYLPANYDGDVALFVNKLTIF